jgi:phage-related protein (TIGR01555 family)
LQGVYENVILDVCGAADIPCTRLFGRSATGLNATGEGDEKVYNGNVEKRQKTTVLPILNRLYPLLMVSTWGHIPDDYSIEFNPVRVSDIHDMARVAEFSERAVSDAYKNGLIDKATAMMELRAMKLNTGMFTNITDEMIDAARDIWVWDDAKKSDTMAYPSSGDRSIASTVDPNDEENNSALISGVGSGEG